MDPIESLKTLSDLIIEQQKEITDLKYKLDNTSQKKYYAKNKTKVMAKTLEWQKSHVEHMRLKREEYYRKKRETKAMEDEQKRKEEETLKAESVVRHKRRVKKVKE